MRGFACAIVVTLLVSSVPVVLAQGDGVHWNGLRLDRNSIPNRLLTNQDGELYSLHEGNADVNIVAFIFTSCTDVCPVITNNLVLVEKQIEGLDYQFISITVDPSKDTPESLKDYSDNFNADWPHLTGTRAELEQVWDDFLISVIEEEVEADNHNHDHHHDEMIHEMMVLYPDNTTSMLEVEMDSLPMENATGWNLTTAATSENNLTLNYSTHPEYGHSVTGINGYDSPEDWSWYWSLMLWNETNMTWQASNVGVDEVMIMKDTDHIAWAASNANQSLIPVPESVNSDMEMNHSNHTTVLHTTQTFILDDNWKPLVVYMGDNWDIDNFVEDVDRASKYGTPAPGDEEHEVPGFTLHIMIVSIGLAIIAARRLD